MSQHMRILFDDVVTVLSRALGGVGMSPERAGLCAELFAEASRDGVASHGLNRFPRFMRMIAAGIVDVRARPRRVSEAGVMERWDGQRGPGNLNAFEGMSRAIAIADTHGIGCVALANTNHWMRGGTYGWQAANAGSIGICWTNTLANMPPWGGADPRIGNNPLVIAVPRKGGHLVLDMAMSQFSVGALTSYASRGEPLPVDGGFDADGLLTRDARAILDSGRLLPIGSWKGSGLSLMLDLVAAALSGGRATHEIDTDPERETDLSQVFIAFRPAAIGAAPKDLDSLADAVVAHVHGGSGDVRHPGERALGEHERSLREGVLVDDENWMEIRSYVHR
jgi:3-dehydro-L-gulonate 2-dehydrogenase